MTTPLARTIYRTCKAIAGKYPAILPSLVGPARWIAARPDMAVKTEDAFNRSIRNLVKVLYGGGSEGAFIDGMAELIQGQLTRAYNQAWRESGEELPLPDYLEAALEDAILTQYDFVDGYAADIVDARDNEQSIEPLLGRADLWAGQYESARLEAVRLIAVENEDNMLWSLGDAEEHCNSCASLDGVVAPAKLWESLGVHPREGPNDKLDCSGYHCTCSLDPTNEKATPGAREIIMIAMAQK